MRPAASRMPLLAVLAVVGVLGAVLVWTAGGVRVTLAAAHSCYVTGASTRGQSGTPGVVTGGVVGPQQGRGGCEPDADAGPGAPGSRHPGDRSGDGAPGDRVGARDGPAEPVDRTGAAGRDLDEPGGPEPVPAEPAPAEPVPPAPAPVPAEPAPAEPAPAEPARPPAEPAPIPPSPAVDPVWDRLAQCESNGNWGIDTGNGYYGGLQFDAATWRAYGGTEFARLPHQATREQQVVVATRVRDDRGGYGSWPDCARRLSLPR